MIKLVVIAALLILAAVMAFVRLTPSDPAQWHVDPRAVPRPATPNAFLIRPVGGDAMPPHYALSAPELARIIDDVALSQPRTERIAGQVDSGHMTYLVRSRLMGYPDYVSVRVYAAEGGASFAALSRSRFGHSDLGVNRARMELWLGLIDARVRALTADPAPDTPGNGG